MVSAARCQPDKRKRRRERRRRATANRKHRQPAVVFRGDGDAQILGRIWATRQRFRRGISGATVWATGAGPITYSLEGTDPASLDIDTGTGQLKTIIGEDYDHEAGSSYSVTVRASNSFGSDTIDVTVELTDLREPPLKPDAPTVTPGPERFDDPVDRLDAAAVERRPPGYFGLQPAIPGRHIRRLDQRPAKCERAECDLDRVEREHVLPGTGTGEERRGRTASGRTPATPGPTIARRNFPKPSRTTALRKISATLPRRSRQTWTPLSGRPTKTTTR